MNEQHEGAEQRLRAADPALATTDAVSEDVLSGLGQRNPSHRLPKKVKGSAIVGSGAGVAALALTLTLSLGGGSQQPLITLGDNSAQATSQGRQELSVGAPALAGDVATESSDKMMMIWNTFNYIPGAELSDETSRGFIYQATKTGDPIQILTELAKRFGVTGTPTEDEYSSPEFPSYSIQGEDFYLSVYWSGTGSWSFGKWSNQPWVDCAWPTEEGAAVEDGATSEGSEGVSEPLPACVEPTPTPELIPSKSALQKEAFELFAATGYNGSISDVTVFRDDWGAWAVASLIVDGQKVAIEWSAGWGQDGQLNWATGHSVEVTKVAGDFGVISASAAVERINEGGWWGGLPTEYYQNVSATDAVGYPSYEEGEVVDVTVESAELVLLTVYDASGNPWLVPGYAMKHSLGWVESVIAVEDGVIALPDYSDVMPLEGVKVVD